MSLPSTSVVAHDWVYPHVSHPLLLDAEKAQMPGAGPAAAALFGYTQSRPNAVASRTFAQGGTGLGARQRRSPSAALRVDAFKRMGPDTLPSTAPTFGVYTRRFFWLRFFEHNQPL
jgi:hypothetical protein